MARKPEAKGNPHNAALVKALKNLKEMLDLFGEEQFAPDFVEWLKEWKGDSLEVIEEREQEVRDGTVVIRNGKVTYPSKGKSVRTKLFTAKEADNLIIVVAKGGKGKIQGQTFGPKKKDDPIVIRLDEADVDSDELLMKAVLFHELVHVKQLRDPESGYWQNEESGKTEEEKQETLDKELKPKFEAEAHLATVFFNTLLMQKHPEGAAEIDKKRKNAKKRAKSFLDKSGDKLGALEQIAGLKGKLRKEIEKENAALEKELAELDALRRKLAEELERYGKSLPQSKTSDKVRKRLEGLEKSVQEVDEALSELEAEKKKLVEKDKSVGEKLGKIADKLKEREKKLEEAEKEADPEKKRRLRDEARDLAREAKELYEGPRGKREEGAKAGLKDEIKRLKSLGKKAGKLGREIKKLLEKIAGELCSGFDRGLIDVLAKLLASLRGAAIALDSLRIKFDSMRALEERASDALDVLF